MKKICVLLLAAFLVCNSATNSQAIEFKAKGSYQLSFDYVDGGNFMSKTRQGKNVTGQQWAAIHQGRDNFEAIQRVHLQLQAIASESLSGTIFFEIGEQRWGKADQGGALGADGNLVKVKRAYIDWAVPNTDLKFRMGMQGVNLPGYSIDNPVFFDDVMGISASYKFNDTVALTALWMRPYNDYYAGGDMFGHISPNNYMDNFDLFSLILPLRFEGVNITPWAMGGSMGPNTVGTGKIGKDNTLEVGNPSTGGQGIDGQQIRDGLLPAAFSSSRDVRSLWLSNYNSMFWGGLSAEITVASPWRFTADFIYGNVDNGRADLNRAGWYGMLLGEYKLDWGTPGLYAWYFSGDDNNTHNGSERLPYVATTNNLTNSLSSFGYRGNPIIGGGKGVLGTNPNGTWGVGARIKKMTFMEDLSHILRVNVFGGTNSTSMASYITGRRSVDDGGRTVYRNNTDFNSFGTYLTTADMGMEVNFDTTYKVYENLEIMLEAGYIHLWLDDSTWGKYGNIAGNSLNYKDAWKLTCNVIYTF